MLLSVGGMVTSPCSAEIDRRFRSRIACALIFRKTSMQEVNFTDFSRCFPAGGQLSLFLSEASEVVLMYLIKYERREALSQNIRKLYSGVLPDRSCNSLRKLNVYPGVYEP